MVRNYGSITLRGSIEPAAYDICAGSEQLTQIERDYTHFYLAFRSIVFKLT